MTSTDKVREKADIFKLMKEVDFSVSHLLSLCLTPTWLSPESDADFGYTCRAPLLHSLHLWVQILPALLPTEQVSCGKGPHTHLPSSSSPEFQNRRDEVSVGIVSGEWDRGPACPPVNLRGQHVDAKDLGMSPLCLCAPGCKCPGENSHLLLIPKLTLSPHCPLAMTFSVSYSRPSQHPGTVCRVTEY